MKPRINTITPGMVLRGNVNGATLEVLKIEELPHCHGGHLAVLRDLDTGRIFTHGLEALKRCDLTVVTAEQETASGMTYQAAETAAKKAVTETGESQLITDAPGGGYELNGDGHPVAIAEERWSESGIVALVFPL